MSGGRAIVASSILLVLGAARIAAAPRIEIDQPIFDFGSVANGTEVVHDFAIRNSGDSELDLGRVVSSCESCLRGSLGGTRIPPGGQAILHARLDLRSLDGAVSRAEGAKTRSFRTLACRSRSASANRPTTDETPSPGRGAMLRTNESTTAPRGRSAPPAASRAASAG